MCRLSVIGLIAMLAANNLAKTEEDRSRYFAALKRVRPLHATSRCIFGPETMARAEILFGEDRAYLAREHGVRLPSPEPGGLENQFFVNEDQISQIARVAGDLGEEGKAIVEFARRYLKPANAA